MPGFTLESRANGFAHRVDEEIWVLIITQDNLMERHECCGPDLEVQEDFLEEAVFSLGGLPHQVP